MMSLIFAKTSENEVDGNLRMMSIERSEVTKVLKRTASRRLP